MSSTAHAVGFSFVERFAQDLRDERLEFPAFPEAVLRIQRALQSPDTSTDEVVRILSSEPALAARLLRMANSAEFRRVGPGRLPICAKPSLAWASTWFAAYRSRSRCDNCGARTRTRRRRRRSSSKHWSESLADRIRRFVLAKRFTRTQSGPSAADGLAARARPSLHHHASKDVPELSDVEMRAGHRWLARGDRQGDSRDLGSTGRAPTRRRASRRLRSRAGRQCVAHRRATRGEARRTGETEGSQFPALRRLGMLGADGKVLGLEEFAEELRGVRSSLSE